MLKSINMRGMTIDPKKPTNAERMRNYRKKRGDQGTTVFLSGDIATAIETAMERLSPKATKKAIIEAALRDWLTAKGFLEADPG